MTPDLACFAKGMANGMPISTVVGRGEVMQMMERLRISVTYGGEALSLAAAVACMKKVRAQRVPEHLWHVGRLLMDGLDSAAAERGIPFHCAGLAPMSMMQFEDLDSAEAEQVWSYFLQEMAARGVLMRRGGANFVTLSHTEEDVAEIVLAAEDVFGRLARLWKSPDLSQHLRVRDVQPGMRSFVRSGTARQR